MKKNNILQLFRSLLVSFLVASLFIGCAKDEKELDGPGQPEDETGTVDIEISHSIEEVIDLYDESDMMEIIDDVVFKGTVISSDSAGNVYKYITLQGENGYGIQVKLNKSGLYADYALGQTVFVKGKGLYLGNYGGTLQIGGVYEGSLGNIEEDVIDDYIVAGEQGTVPTATVLDIDNLPEDIEKLYNTWVSVANVQFDNSEMGNTYAEDEFSAYNRTLTTAEGNTIIVRTSQYADFANEELPEQSGTISAILTVYNGTLQLTLNTSDDVVFESDRFEEVPDAGDLETTHSIQEVLDMYDGSDLMEMTADVVFKGTVISSDSTGNVYKYITIQDNGYGIQIKLNKTSLYTDYALGQTVFIKAKGLYMGNYGGSIQMGGIYEEKFGNIEESEINNHLFAGVEGNVPSAVALDLSALPDNIEDLSNTWVSLSNVQFADSELGKKYADDEFSAYNRTLVDANGNTIVVRTSKYSDFAGETLPEKNGTIQAILTIFNGTPQLTLNAPDDIDFTNERFTTTPPVDAEGTGILTDAYNIAAAVQNVDATGVWVKGYIIGSVNGSSLASNFEAGATDNSSYSNIVIAASADETDATKGMPIQLLSGSFIRSSLNLKDNPEMAGKEVWVKGDILTYFGVPGIKSASDFSFDGATVEEEEVLPPSGTIGAGDDILGSSLTNTSIDFMTYNVLQNEEIWAAANGEASINGYNNGEVESWMISKSTVDFSSFTKPGLLVTENLNYFKGFEKVQVMVSSDYAGSGDPSQASWTVLSTETDRAQFGESLSQFVVTSGSYYIAFKYLASSNTDASSWTIKTVVAGEIEEEDDETPVDPAPAPGENLILNGGFENWTDDKPDSWTKAENVSQESTVVNEGSSAVKHTAGGTKDISQTISIQAGKTYIVSFDYNVESGDGTDGRLWSFFKNAANSSIGDIKDPNDYLENSAGNGSWNTYTAEYTAPADAVSIYFEIRTYGSAVVVYDNVSIKEKVVE
ncbi:DUF5689 domain-containing protein [Flammeovirga sp. SubArs3]|uniref:DUF5689 domain-containing protein n=1 Tax=Flammeovirga sp. SubArs3 TaxID=2995316 RepID=UPI00248B0D5A|nr:DUF5689 domain-containing protein [Flammeovirga sp. SubArs3]